MQLPVNVFKQAIAQRRRQIGLWLALGNTSTAEICFGAGFDWAVIDAEHGPQTIPGIMAQLQVAAGYPRCHPVVRVQSPDTGAIKPVLDVGATTILVPMVETAAEAAAVVNACRYPPHGVRGVGGTRAARWGRYPNYLREANDQLCIIVQIETVTGLDNLDAICAVEGVDGIFIGPADLAASLGHIGDPAHPDIQSRIDAAFERIKELGKPSGTLVRNEDLARAYLERGVAFVAVGMDTLLLANATTSLAQRFQIAST